MRFHPYLLGAALVCSGMTTSAFAQQDQQQKPLDPIYADLPPPPGAVQNAYHQYDEGERLKDGAEDPYRMAVPQSRSVTVSMQPGGQTNIVRLAQGYPSSLTFLDSTGQPWPIAWNLMTNKTADCDRQGGGENAAIRAVGINACVPVAGSNVVQLTPLSRYPRGGVLISLEKARQPIYFVIIAGPGVYDGQMTVRVKERGPRAQDLPVLEADAPETGAPWLTALLDGVPPEQATPLTVTGVSADDLRAWRYRGQVLLRTRYVLDSPAPTAHETEYGVTAYVLRDTSRLLMTVNGQLTGISLGEEGP
ncbi:MULTISPECIES: DotH/IcmK family type IV secretion protein [Asaia]|uniref:Type IV secretion protein DotH n=1 Tax=Asaia spathodeae TaxID=657016 RepID=A0ABX2P9K7_9PROT|nr:DotH/IcmK family type IV secretion protein [Asaia spathodeae]GBR20296.1 DotH protein [Asaia spathodeae NBRC 105894]